MKILSVLHHHYRLLFFSSIYFVYISVLFLRCNFSDSGDIGHNLVRLIGPYVELGLVSLVCAICARRSTLGARFFWLGLGGLIAASTLAVYFAQTVSLYLSNNLITPLALGNTDSTGFINSPSLRAAGLSALLWLALFMHAMARSSSRDRPTSRREKNTGLRICTLLVLNLWLLLLQRKDSNLEVAFWQTPVANLVHNLFVVSLGYDALVTDKSIQDNASQCLSYSKSTLNIEGPAFQKEFVYKSALPFTSLGDDGSARPNVIILFTEGLSARIIGAYGGNYPGLTPSIDALAKRSLQVYDYFNHTAPTYRGLIGQLSSGYAYADGSGENGWETGNNISSLRAIRRQTLSSILRNRGYEAYFFSPHIEHSAFTVMLRSLGFNDVYTYESIGHGLLNGHFRTRANTGALEDQSLFAGLIAFLRQRDSEGDNDPFFIALYNIGTHTFIDINKKGDVPYEKGHEPFLNKVHNYDAALGSFLRYYNSSPFSKNTILVFTADHASYPDAMYRAVAGPNLHPYFFDRIPLFIRDPLHQLPSSWDANGRNSLDLAPTILHLLGIRDAPNSFLGNSLFERRSLPLGIGAEGSSYFLTTPSGVYARNDVPQSLKPQFECEARMVDEYYLAEKNNLLFKN